MHPLALAGFHDTNPEDVAVIMYTVFARYITVLGMAFTLPYLTFGADDTLRAVQRSDHQVGPLRIPAKPKAKETSQKL